MRRGDSRSRVGVLCLQGDFARHSAALATAGCESREVRRAADLAQLAGLILPGGESTTMLKFFEAEPWEREIKRFAASGKPILATCAGLILLASHVENPSQHSLGLLDVDVVRNAYGRQVDSFVGRAKLAAGGEIEAVFIRAPKISRVGAGVDVLASEKSDPVLVRQGNIFGASFHPELSAESSIHAEVFGAGRGATIDGLSRL